MTDSMLTVQDVAAYTGLTDQQVGAFFDVLRQGDSEEVAMAEVRELAATVTAADTRDLHVIRQRLAKIEARHAR